MKPFEQPIFVTRPMLPDLKRVNLSLEEIWESQWLTNGGKQHVRQRSACAHRQLRGRQVKP